MMTLSELLKLHRELSEIQVERWVARGLLRPVEESETWRFEEVDVARTGLLTELVADMGIDDDTAETMVDLLDQVHALRRQLGVLGEAISQQPDDTRAAIADALRKLSRS
jgi:chaperone modulatory protein CbpM